MTKWLISFGLLVSCALPAQAQPATAEDDPNRFVAESGLLQRLGEVGGRVTSSVTSTTSELVVTAMGFLGVPYRRGGNSVETGFDCSGFVRAIYEQTVGLILPRRANEQAAATQVIDKRELQPGDLVFFNTLRRAFSHVGIYVGEGKFIHSPKPGAQVRVEDMNAGYWQRRFDGARRVMVAQQQPVAAAGAPSAP
jgi:cell wall-associated NlpC family hydrolase